MALREKMKSKIMTLSGHYAAPKCKYSECRTPVEYELFLDFKSIDRMLKGLDNCKQISKNDFPIKEAAYHERNCFWSYANIVTKADIKGVPYYIIVMMADKFYPVLAVDVIGKEEKTIDGILKDIAPSVSKRCERGKWHKYDLQDSRKDFYDMERKRIKDLVVPRGLGGHN